MMRVVSTHQSSFLPYIGFWWKVINSDEFIVNAASDFSTTSMYYRTFMPKKNLDDLEYWTVGINRKIITREDSILDVQLQPDAMNKLKNQFLSHCAFYKRQGAMNANAVKRYLLPVFEAEYKYLHELNEALFKAVYDWLHCSAQIWWNNTASYNEVDNKSKRLAHQLERFCDNVPGTVYISGPSGRNYLDESAFKEVFDAHVLYQQEVSGEFYHGSILHHMFTMRQADLPQFIETQFTWRYKD